MDHTVRFWIFCNAFIESNPLVGTRNSELFDDVRFSSKNKVTQSVNTTTRYEKDTAQYHKNKHCALIGFRQFLF